MKNYYKILGIPENANEAAIKKAYRALAVKYHPDKNPAREATVRFSEITEAYNVLSDQEKKFVYDHQWYKYVHQPTQVHKPVQQQRDSRQRSGTKSPKPEKPAYYLIMEQWSHYGYWLNVAAVVMVLLFAVDYVLPYAASEEVVTDNVAVASKGLRGGTHFQYFRMHTSSGKNIQVYNRIAPEGDSVRLAVTRLYRVPMHVETTADSRPTSLAFMYRQFIFFPIALFLTAIMGVLFRKNVEQSFSCGLATLILLLINGYLIY